MEPSEIAAGYDQLADVWNSPGFSRDNGIAMHQRALRFLRARRHALDIGCGSSGRFIDLLLDNGFAVEGLDLSERMIALARVRHPDVRFHHADICHWEFPRGYDFISAWDCLWHLPLAQQQPVLSRILRNLEPGGVFVFTMGGLDAPGEKTDAAMGPGMYYSTPGIPDTLALVARNGAVCRHLEFDQHPEQHLCMIVQKADPR